MLENIELFGTGRTIALTGLSGRMTRCTDDLSEPQFNSEQNYYEFGFEFSPGHYPQISRIKRYLSTGK